MSLVCRGMKNKEIAEELYITAQFEPQRNPQRARLQERTPLPRLPAQDESAGAADAASQLTRHRRDATPIAVHGL